MSSDHEITNTTPINTSGGPVVDGAVNTGGGDFVGRDKITITEEVAYTVHGLANPYLGLRAFRYEDRAIYAGREQLAQETVQRLTAPGTQQPLLFITGASGSGKSSFAQAGLIPLLENHYDAYQKTVRHAIMRPSSQPMVMLADALQKLHPDLTPETLTTNTPKDQVNLLLIDQFEELFIQSDASQRAPFCDFLTKLPSFADCRTHILITLRVDYLDELFAIQPLWAIAKEGVELRTMSADDLRNAIQKPLQINHPQKRFAPELLARLVKDASADAALLPLLQVTLAELWKTGKLVLSNYHSLTDAIRQRAEMVYAFSDHANADPKIPRPADDQQELISILLDLINVSVDSADHRDARQRRTRQELEQGSTRRPRLIEELVNARLLAAASETRNGTDVEVIDIIHESLIDNWDRLRNAIEEQRQQLQRRARFKLWLGEWLRNGRQDGYLLLTDMQLAEAQALVEVRDIEVQRVEAQALYRRSVEWREAERQKELQRARELAEAQRQRARVFRNGVIVAGLLFLLAAAAAGVSYYLNGELSKTNGRLQTTANVAFSRQLAIQSTSELNKNRYEPAILLAIAAGRAADTREAFSVIRSVIANQWHSRIVLFGHTGEINQATWNRDESKILTSSVDQTARIWDAVTGTELIRMEGHTASISQATLSQDESKVLTGSSDNTARIWDAVTGKELVRLTGIGKSKDGLAIWSQDESKILTKSGYPDDIAYVWDVATGTKLLKFENVSYVSWNKDGSKILCACYDDTVRIFDAATGEELLKIIHPGYVDAAVWSQDETVIFTSGYAIPPNFYKWDASTGEKLLEFGQVASIFLSTGTDKILIGNRIFATDSGQQLATLDWTITQAKWTKWRHDDRQIVTIANDGIARVWDVTTGQKLIDLSSASSATWSKKGDKLLISSKDGTIRIWDMTIGYELPRLIGHEDQVWNAVWSKDGRKILTNSYDNTVRVWDAASGQELLRLEITTEENTFEGSWNQDGSKILTISGYPDNTARIWDATTGQELLKLVGHESDIHEAAWNKKEDRVLTRAIDGTVRVWNVATGQELVKLVDPKADFTFMSWNRDENKILTISNSSDKSATVWDTTTGQKLIQIAEVNEATWNNEGNRILTINSDAFAYIWSAATGQKLFQLVKVNKATWSNDGSKILTTSDNNNAIIWDADRGQDLVQLVNVDSATWSWDDVNILTLNNDGTVHIWNSDTGIELLGFHSEAYRINQLYWSQDKNRILTINDDGTASIWDIQLTKGLSKEIAVLKDLIDGISGAIWDRDKNRILTINNNNAVSIWYIHMSDLLVAACQWTPRNFTWTEWSTYMADNVGTYRPTCPNAPIPPDAIAGIQDEARQLLRNGEIDSATQRLTELNGWLQVNGQFKNYGVDVDAFVAEVSTTATAAALPPTATPTPVAP